MSLLLWYERLDRWVRTIVQYVFCKTGSQMKLT